ncbi:MAG: hypothetical protein Q8Q54_14285 [Methylococcales bacterium]|nr:hypothetical protein [Methylococcales bacterium]MDP3840082.1 hypothetical protein [Methylococcales bacterium]
MKNSIYTTWPLLLSVSLLILNDHVFKYSFSGIVTGKISDFAGIFLIVLVLRDVFPKRVLETSVLVVGLFLYWKSPYSQALIEFINTYSPLEFIRTVDYSDLVAFTIIPVAHFVYENRNRFTLKLNIAELIKIPAIVLTVLGITGTSTLPYVDTYEIRKKSSSESIDIVKAINAIENVTNAYNLICKKCNPLDNAGLYMNDRIRLDYRVLENNRGIKFLIDCRICSRQEVDQIKSDLQYSLGHRFKGMEFVIK